MDERELTIQFNSDIAEGDSNARIAFYANIGFFIEIAQMLEFNLRKLICYHNSVTEIEKEKITKERVKKICDDNDNYYIKTYKDKFTLGRLTKELRNLSILQTDVLDIFDEINDYRILVVHKIFQNNIIVDKFKDSKYVMDYTNQRLLPMIEKVITINKMVIKVIEAYRDDLHKYKEEVGLSTI
jgi:hypothetical protein